jgi:hypothetical protein
MLIKVWRNKGREHRSSRRKTTVVDLTKPSGWQLKPTSDIMNI